jgi:hypothetical protein
MVKFRSDSSAIVSGAERALFDDQNSGAYIGDPFELTSKRNRVPRARVRQPEHRQEPGGRRPGGRCGPDPGGRAADDGIHQYSDPGAGTGQHPQLRDPPRGPDQWPTATLAARFFARCTVASLSGHRRLVQQHEHHAYAERVKRMFSPRTPVPADPARSPCPTAGPTVHNGAGQAGRRAGCWGTTRCCSRRRGWPPPRTTTTAGAGCRARRCRCGRDFNTLDDPFAWAPGGVGPTNKPGMHFVAFVPGHHLFHRARWRWTA